MKFGNELCVTKRWGLNGHEFDVVGIPSVLKEIEVLLSLHPRKVTTAYALCSHVLTASAFNQDQPFVVTWKEHSAHLLIPTLSKEATAKEAVNIILKRIDIFFHFLSERQRPDKHTIEWGFFFYSKKQSRFGKNSVALINKTQRVNYTEINLDYYHPFGNWDDYEYLGIGDVSSIAMRL